MLKVRNKKFSLLMALVFAFTMVFPWGAAFAAEYDSNVPVVDDDAVMDLGTVTINVDPGELKAGNRLNLRLPSDFQFVFDEDGDGTFEQDEIMGQDQWDETVEGDVYMYGTDGSDVYANIIQVPEFYRGSTNDNALYGAGMLKVTSLSENEIQLTVEKTPNAGLEGYLAIDLGAVYVEEGFDGDVALDLDGTGGFDDGSLTVGRVSGGEVDIEVIDAPNFGDDTSSEDPVRIRFNEDRAGGLDDGEDESIKLTLPDGFEWKKFSVGKGEVEALTPIEEAVEALEDSKGVGADDELDDAIAAVDDIVGGDDFDTTKAAAKTAINTAYEAVTGSSLDANAAKSSIQDAYSIISGLDESDVDDVIDASDIYKQIDGDNILDKGARIYTDGDELIIDTSGMSDGTTSETIFELTLGIRVEDETDAETGDVVAKVDGETTCTQDEIVVGTYGDYDVTMDTGDVPTIYAGQLEQIIADVKVNESVAGSMIDGRSLLLTLPAGAKWGQDGDMDSDDDNKASLKYVGLVGDDGRTAKWTVDGESSNDAGELTLGDMEVMVEPGFEGDLTAEVGGTMPVDVDEITLAKVVPAVKITAEKVDGLVIGRDAQDVGDITITEADAGLIKDGEDLVIDLPRGVSFANEPEVTVTEGDLEIDDVSVKDDDSDEDNQLVIGINDDSNDASTIVISGIQYLLDRTVAEGDIKVSVKGSAVNEVNDEEAVKDEIPTDEWDARDIDEDGSDEGLVFPQTEDAAVVVNASVGTPAPTDQKLTTTITLGDNGSYISDGRIMVQLRDAATALGVEPQNIFWDNATKSATFVKGERIVQITVGDPQVKLNGTSLPTDKGAEIKDGRTFVSLSAAGVALNAVTAWDNNTKTATLTVK